MEVTMADPLDELVSTIQQGVDRYRRRMEEDPYPCGSRALAFAQAAGLPVRMAYTVADTARYTGVSAHTLREEHEAGRLAFVMSPGAERGSLVPVAAVDAWMDENAR
jgi:excisionase family DNA binding protein